jgi:8-oxo-dGTP pyrophosphatase MutT (NUDIX family)
MMNIFGTILKFIIASTNHSNMSERFKVLVFEAIYVLVQTLNKIVAGEVSLPGGKAEEHDKDDGITATREAEEEIGLDPSLVDVVAFLEPFLSQVSKSAHCLILKGMHVHINRSGSCVL